MHDNQCPARRDDYETCLCDLLYDVRLEERKQAAQRVAKVQEETRHGEGIIVQVLVGAGRTSLYINRDLAVAAARGEETSHE